MYDMQLVFAFLKEVRFLFKKMHLSDNTMKTLPS